MPPLHLQTGWRVRIVAAALVAIALPLSEHAGLAEMATQPTADQCTAAIPPEAAALVRAKFPDYRLPRETDSLRDYRQSSLESGGSACLLVADGDFDGDSSRDIAIILVPISPGSSDSTLLIAARHPSSGWQLDRLRELGAPEAAFVTRLAPGSYKMAEAARREGGTLEPGEVSAFNSKRDGIDAGKMEASDIGFFFSQRRWRHIWLSD